MADATTSLELLLLAKDQASKVLDDVKDKAGGMGKALGDVAKIAGGFVVAQGITQLGGFLVDAAKGAAEDQAATDRLNKSLENYIMSSAKAGETTADYAMEIQELKDDMEDRIKAGQKLAFSDDDIRDSMQALIAATGDYGEASKRQAAAMDLARGANIPLATATKMLGKLNEENIEVFKKMGIVIGENATEADALAAVQAKFGGQAETYAKSTAGQFEQAKIRMAELKETIGAALLPVMTALMTVAVTKLLPAVESLANTYLPLLSQGFNTLRDAVQPALDKITPFIEAFTQNKTVLTAAAVTVGVLLVGAFAALAISAGAAAVSVLAASAPFIAVAAAIGVLVAGIILLVKNWDTITEKVPILGKAFELAKQQVETQIQGIVQMIRSIVEIVTSVVSLVSALVHGDWSKAWTEMKDIANSTIDLFLATLKAQFGNIPKMILGLATELFNAGLNMAEQIIDGIRRGLQNFKVKVGFDSGIPGVPGISKTIQPFSFLKEGLDFVPYDNFPAMLHRGERVVPAHENRGGAGVNVYIDNVNARDESEARRAGNDIGYAISLRRAGVAA